METDRSMLQMKVNDIFSFDRALRYVVFLALDGKPTASFGRPGVTSLEPESETETVYVKATIALNMSAPMDKYFGRIRTVILVREKVTIICFNLSARILLISTDPSFELQKIEKLGHLVDQLNID